MDIENGLIWFNTLTIAYELSLGNYWEVAYALEVGLFKHNEIVAASLFTGQDIFILFQIKPHLINICDPFLVTMFNTTMQLKSLELLNEKAMLALWEVIRVENVELYNKMHEAFLIDESSVHFFPELPNNKWTWDQWLLLAEFCDYSADFFYDWMEDSMVNCGCEQAKNL